MDWIISITFILVSLIIGSNAFGKYLKARVNHEYLYYFSLAFFCMALEFALTQFDTFYHIRGINMSLHILQTFLFMFLLYAFSYTRINCGEKHNCKVCWRKILRISFWFVIFAIILPISPMVMYGGFTLLDSSGFASIQLVGIKSVDLYIEIIHSAIAFAIALIIPRNTPLLKIAIGLISLSELSQVINIWLYEYKHQGLFQFEWALSLVAILLTFYGINKLIRDAE